jgi:hypothetical protein
MDKAAGPSFQGYACTCGHDDLTAALAARDTDQGAGALGALVDRWRPITPTYHAVVAGEHLAACIACLMVAELDEVLPR